jgi:hypothetical protein
MIEIKYDPIPLSQECSINANTEKVNIKDVRSRDNLTSIRTRVTHNLVILEYMLTVGQAK